MGTEEKSVELDPWVRPVLEASEEKSVHEDRKVSKALKVRLVLEVNKDLEALRESKDHVVLRVFEAILTDQLPTSCWRRGPTSNFKRKDERSK